MEQKIRTQSISCRSFHTFSSSNANLLFRSQAATAHSYGLPELAALRSVTSVPAKSLEVDHRIGYARPGYDADLVVWDSHPLSVGATPLQVYIDGRPTLPTEKLQSVQTYSKSVEKPKMRTDPPKDVEQLCSRIGSSQSVLITGISQSYLDLPQTKTSSGEGLAIAINSGKITCLGRYDECVSATGPTSNVIALQNGHVLPGLTAFSTTLGLLEIPSEKSTSDGVVSSNVNPLDPENVVYAKYGIHLEGRAFERARVGGVTRAVTAPNPNGFLSGVSVGIKTGLNKTILDDGIFQDDVALHFAVGQESKGVCMSSNSDILIPIFGLTIICMIESEQTPTVSTAIAKLRKILFENKGKETIYGKAADGKFPVVIYSQNKVPCYNPIIHHSELTSLA